MALEGLHHITAITADAPRNVDFYARVLGLRLVKKTVNFDQPDVYHLYFGDERGTPGSILTFFEFPGAALGQAGDGMVHTIQWRVASDETLDFWAARLADADVTTERTEDGALAFADFEGLRHELLAVAVDDAPLAARAPDIPAEHALLGFHGVRAYASRPEASTSLLEAIGFTHDGGADWTLRGAERHAVLHYDAPPAHRGVTSAGTVHHVAWSVGMDEQDAWRERVIRAGARPTPVIDRFWFRSVYFREPSGVLFELATLGPGFGIDEDPEHLGESLILPPAFEHLRSQVEQVLTPLPDPRAAWKG